MNAVDALNGTLADFLCPNLAIVSVGINPSPVSVTKGYPFASSRNRFWPALNQSKLSAAQRPPSIDSMHRLLEIDRIGFTDIVKRPTRQANELRVADYRAGAQTLLEKLTACDPMIVWFQGMLEARAFFKYSESSSKYSPRWGAQEVPGLTYRVFVSPNPSPANASYSLTDLIGCYDELAAYRKIVSATDGCKVVGRRDDE